MAWQGLAFDCGYGFQHKERPAWGTGLCELADRMGMTSECFGIDVGPFDQESRFVRGLDRRRIKRRGNGEQDQTKLKTAICLYSYHFTP